MAEVPSSGFYTAGGTLRADAPSYVVRKADTDLLDGLRVGEFCYVLDTRQMGKSSLMVRAADDLRREGFRVVVLDLTEIGQNLSVEQWYYGLLVRLGEQLGIEDELIEHWRGHKEIGPLHRWMDALRQVVLSRIEGRIVIFVDEIDAVRSLPFSTDEFFAGIRECYNRRAEDPVFNRLTFCLLGVATPADLIQDVRTTPFNIGRRIELNDFTESEASTLAKALGGGGRDGGRALRRVLHWTSGHPYLTQRMCQEIADDTKSEKLSEVDRICEGLFLTRPAQEADDNLAFVRNRMLRSEEDVAGLLDLYSRVWRNKRVKDDETILLVSRLRLSGIVREVGGFLRVRNRIYERVFDRSWVLRNMPDAELRRQRAAYRRGLLRATGIAALVLAVIGMLALNSQKLALKAERSATIASREMNRALRAESSAQLSASKEKKAREIAQVSAASEKKARQEAQTAAAREQIAAAQERTQRKAAQQATAVAHRETLTRAQALYAADMNLAQNQFKAENLADTLRLLDAHRPGRDPADLRGFEWYYLWGQCHSDLMTLNAHSAGAFAAVPSPDGRLLVTAGRDKIIKIWDMKSWRLLRTIAKHTHTVECIAFSPDGKSFATCSADETARIWETSTGRELLVVTVPTAEGITGAIHSLCFSPDGRRLLTTSQNRAVWIWDIHTGRRLLSLVGHTGRVDSSAFSPDGSLVATTSADNTVRLWNSRTGEEIRKLDVYQPWSVAFSPDGKHLAVGSAVGVEYRDATSGEIVWQNVLGKTIPSRYTYSVTFSPDGKQVATAGSKGVFAVWNVPDGSEVFAYVGHRDRIWSIRYSPDGTKLITAGWDGDVKVWDAIGTRSLCQFDPSSARTFSVAFSRDGRRIAADCVSGGVKIWDTDTRREIVSVKGREERYQQTDRKARSAAEWSRPCSIDFSPDGRRLVALSEDDGAAVWDLVTERTLRALEWKGNRITSAKYSSDGKRIVTGTLGGTTIVWDASGGKKPITLDGHTDKINSAVFSPDGTRVATASRDRTARLWDAATGRTLYILRGHTDEIASVAFSPDGRSLLTASWDKTVVLWDTHTGSKLAGLIVSGAAVAQFFPCGVRAACADREHAITWDLRSGRATWSDSPWGDGSLYSITVSPDGRRIAAGGDFGRVVMWTAPTDSEIAAYERRSRAQSAATLGTARGAKK